MNPYCNYTDTELVAALNQGDRKVFEIIYNRYVNQLYRYARRLIVNKEDCEEIVQDVFERLWSSHSNIRPIALRAYLFTSTRNKIIDYFRKTEVRKKYNEHFALFETLYEPSVDLETEHHAERLHKLIEDGISELPERVQMAIRLRLEENLSNSEIAVRMNVTNKTIENYMHLVYTHFRESYATLSRVK